MTVHLPGTCGVYIPSPLLHMIDIAVVNMVKKWNDKIQQLIELVRECTMQPV